jgi:hypothetical protein
MTPEQIRAYMETTENGLARETDPVKFYREVQIRTALALFEIAAQLAEMNDRESRQ